MTQLTLVTGNNNGICISEYKSKEFNDLSPSLCTLNFYATNEFLYYSIVYEGLVHYLKKLHWQDSQKECLGKEFNNDVEFANSRALFFGSDLKLIPKSFYEKDNTTSQLINTSNNQPEYQFSEAGQYTSAFTIDNDILSAVRSAFPASKTVNVITDYCIDNNSSRNTIKLFQLSDHTIVLLFKDNNLVLAEQYETPTETESLYFTLSALQIQEIENTDDCTLELIGCQKREELYQLFSQYFKNINFPDSIRFANSISLTDSELNEFQFVLGKSI